MIINKYNIYKISTFQKKKKKKIVNKYNIYKISTFDNVQPFSRKKSWANDGKREKDRRPTDVSADDIPSGAVLSPLGLIKVQAFATGWA